MTLLEFWGCAMITFGPALAMFSLTVAHDPVKVIILILSAFFWLLSFLSVSIMWAIVKQFCDYLIIGVYLAVLSQEIFRYLFHLSTKKAQAYLNDILGIEDKSRKSSSTRSHELQIDYVDKMSLSYVSGLGFGLMNGAFAIMNVLSDYIGPGTVGLNGDSQYFLITSSLTTLAFILLNVSWSVLLSAGIEKSDRRLAFIVMATHFTATTVTFFNQVHLQFISIIVVYSLALICGLGALQVSGLAPGKLYKTSIPN